MTKLPQAKMYSFLLNLTFISHTIVQKVIIAQKKHEICITRVNRDKIHEQL